MRISDWSSDVCSSDLRQAQIADPAAVAVDQRRRIGRIFAHRANCDAKGKRLASKACYGAPMNRIVDTNAASVRHLADLHAAHDADVGVILVQVDQLARINHSAGTEAGDALLEEVARRLENFAGDEFGHGALVRPEEHTS